MRDVAIRDIEIALAVSTRQWSAHLHRFLVDHGGARVRLYVMQPQDAFSEEFDVLLIDDICSFLSPHLVENLNRAGHRVVGVYSPAEFSDGKDRLLACGVTEVIESDAGPEEFLALIDQLEINRESHGGPPDEEEDRAFAEVSPQQPAPLVAVGSPPGGCGATEVAIALARRMAEITEGVGLLDLDQRAPSVAQRLGLGLHPNLLTAIDAVYHHSDSLESCWHTMRGSSLRILPGVPNLVDRSHLRRSEVAEVLLETARVSRATVVNFGHWQSPSTDQPVWGVTGSVSDAVMEMASVVVGVALPNPVGIIRMVEWIGDIRARRPEASIHVVVNKAPGSLSVRKALFEELSSAVGPARIAFLPEDTRVAEAAWNGVLVERGRFRRGCDRLADQVLEGVFAHE
ncbi:MAG: hypothetical protein OXC98_09810 [bacterium]|nr:hypothetical protein [Acidimicrobiia bacterium]MCY4650645.1 hypothetical protein [bacterium]